MRRLDVITPMGAMLDAAQGTIRLHMPGHKGLLGPSDITELARTDDLYAPAGAIAEAERLAAQSFGAAHTIMLTGGSTAGLMAMLLSTLAPGDSLILPRNMHHAALSACIWGGIDALFTDDILAQIQRTPAAKAVLVTYPDYYGRCIDLPAIITAAHASGMRVLVDEAHGAHFAFWDAPKSSGALGADAWVQSAHKTLPALTGAAWLHLAAGMDAARARRTLRMVQTSSPPFPILRSLDEARAWMDANGRDALTALLAMLAKTREGITQLSGYTNIHSDDPTRLVIGTRERGHSGLAIQEMLSAQRVDVEMADNSCIVCICTVMDTPETLTALLTALDTIPQLAPLPQPAQSVPPPGRRILPIREAALSAHAPVPLTEAPGRTAATSAGMYPPGIPLILPGEEITVACAEALASLPDSRRFGVENGCLICVKTP